MITKLLVLTGGCIMLGFLLGFSSGVKYVMEKKEDLDHRKPNKPNNQYEVIVHPDFYIIKDGDRTVDSIPFGRCRNLDTIILKDNL